MLTKEQIEAIKESHDHSYLEELCDMALASAGFVKVPVEPMIVALKNAHRVLVEWQDKYGEWSHAMPKHMDLRLPPAGHIRVLEDISEILAAAPARTEQTEPAATQMPDSASVGGKQEQLVTPKSEPAIVNTSAPAAATNSSQELVKRLREFTTGCKIESPAEWMIQAERLLRSAADALEGK